MQVTSGKRILVACAAMLLAGLANAQALHRCSVNGRTVMSDRPCAPVPTTTLGAVGAPRFQPPGLYGPPARPVEKAPEHLSYMGSECAELREGLRNGPARGLTAGTYAELQANYQRRCREDERLAHKKMGDDEQQRRRAREDAEKALAADRQKEQLAKEQCDEMWRIVHRRRQRLATMDEGERADFGRFEGNWRDRCGGRS